MKLKRSMIVLLVTVFCLLATPALAFAASELPEVLPATEEMSFNPLIYVTILLGVISVCAVIVSIVLGTRYKEQSDSVCKLYDCPSNPVMLKEREGQFDYSLLETPDELSGGYTSQSEFAREEELQRIAAEQAQLAAMQKQSAAALQAKVAAMQEQSAAALQAKVAAMQEQSAAALYRQNTAAQVQGAVAQVQNVAAQVQDSAAQVQYAPKFQRAQEGITAPMPAITIVPKAKHAHKAPAQSQHIPQRSIALPPLTVQTPVTVQTSPAQNIDVPEELEFLLRKIS